MSDAVIVAELPFCDLCQAFGRAPAKAVVDGKTKQGPWAFMCAEHWASYGVGRLGTGYGQKLLLKP